MLPSRDSPSILVTLSLCLFFFLSSSLRISCRNPTWWKRRSGLERGLTVIAVSGFLLCVALAVALGILAANTTCGATSKNGKQRWFLWRPIHQIYHVRTYDACRELFKSAVWPTSETRTLSSASGLKGRERPLDDSYAAAIWRSERAEERNPETMIENWSNIAPFICERKQSSFRSPARLRERICVARMNNRIVPSALALLWKRAVFLSNLLQAGTRNERAISCPLFLAGF